MKLILVSAFTLCFVIITSAQSANSLKKIKAPPATAPWFVEKFRISAGIFVPVNNTNIQIGNSNGSPGTEIDFERKLGFSRETSTLLANIQWRSGRRSRFEVGCYSLKRSSFKSIDKTFEFGEDTFRVNASLKTIFNNDILRVSWGYAIISKPRGELGVLIGAHTLKTTIGMEATLGSVGGAESESFDFITPVPDLGIWGGYAISPRFAINGEFNYLSGRIGNIKGDLIGYNLVLMYKPVSQLDISLGYAGFDFLINSQKNNRTTRIEWGYKGPSCTIGYSFGKKKWTH